MDCPDGSCVIPNLTRGEKRKGFDHANTQETYEGLCNDAHSIGRSYLDNQSTASEIEGRLHDLWDELIHAARTTPALNPEHDRLVVLIMKVRELGPFPVNQKDRDVLPPAEIRDTATLPNGERLWVDLPYLVQEIQDSWINESMGFSSAERQSLAVLTAKLCAVGICSDSLSHCALWLFKEALETERPDISSLPSARLGDGSEEDSRPTILDLLPACLEWLKHNNTKLAKLSLVNYDPGNSTADADGLLTTPGELAIKSNVRQPGFSLARWLFWRQRFKDLYRSGNEPLIKMGRACFDESIFSGLGAGLIIPGEKIYLDRLFEAIDKELAARGNIGSVDATEVEIDMDWDKED
ncbi:hypothetical protein MaudCBS49596_000175 [Microsporum audouinii]